MAILTLEQRYLETLVRIFAGGPAGIEAIAHVMQVSPQVLIEEVEPSLLASKIIHRTIKGRCANPKALEIVKITSPSMNPQEGFPDHTDV